jgi:hypothetical protein
MRNATWYFATDVRWPGSVAARHRVERFVAAPVVVIGVEEENH